MKKILFFLFFSAASIVSYSQVSVNKMVGKNVDKFKTGYGIFGYYDFPLNEEGTNSVRLEIIDFVYYPGKEITLNYNTYTPVAGYLSIKLGYRKIFSETKTGFYLEPSAGYARVVYDIDPEDDDFGDGIALALEGGYSLEVGQNGQTLSLGLKYETDRAGAAHTISSIGLRAAYTFNLFKKKN